MKRGKSTCARLLLWSLVLLLALPPGGIMAQGQGSNGQAMFSQEELDQMLAPIALYPDDLLVQVLMAATYPLEVVQAARWVAINPNLKGDRLAAALEEQPWDPSVKSLVNFPTVLQMMNDRLEWMQMLGDAFLAQEEQVMDTVQQLRERAQAQGNLMTTSEQRVIVDPQSREIMIEPVAPQIIYVPVYDPMIVYGSWWWPAHRPYFYHPRGVIIRSGTVLFGLGVAIGVAWGYAWGGFNWHHHDVVINVTRHVNINNHIDRNRYVTHVTTGGGGQGTWRHDPVHRQGVAYRAPSVAEQYGRGPRPGADTRRDFRGFDRGEAGAPGRGPAGPVAQPPRVAPAPPAARPETPRLPPGPGREPHPAPAPQVRTEAPRPPSAPMQQPRVAPGPAVAKPEPPRQPAPPVQVQPPRPEATPPVRVEPPRPPSAPVQAQQPHPAPAPQVRTEAPRQPAPPVQQPRVAPAPPVVRSEPARQPSAPGRQAVQGVQGPTAFGGSVPGGQAKQFSNRGHESLGGAPAGGQPASANRPAPGGGRPGSAPQGGGHGNPQGKR